MRISKSIFPLSTVLLIFCLIGFSSCDNNECFDEANPLCENYNPCLQERETSANFSIYDCITCHSPDSLMRETDSSFGGLVIFEAHEELESYEWTIGTDARVFREKRVSLTFFGFSGIVEVQLVGRKSVNANCFPDDDGIDTIRKTLVIVEPDYERPFINKEYIGYNESEPDSIFTISFGSFAGLNDFPRGCHRPDNWLITTNFGFYTFKIINDDARSYWDCGYPTGYGELAEDRRTLTVYYQVTENDVRVDKKFIGKLIE
jgi:hypothetical protein